MSHAMTREAPSRHPWLDEFARAPEAGFASLLAGYARIPPYERADPADAARMLFGPLPVDDPARRMLGGAILAWLQRRRREMPPTDRPRLQHWIAEICEAFEIVSALEVKEAAAELRRHFILWNEWTAQFVLSSARDAHGAYWRMLALTQPLLRSTAPTIDPATLEPLWLEICRQAGNPLPRRYLEIGLLGLRRLVPSPAGPGSEAPWVAGLAHWALAQQPTQAEFQGEWRALKPLYPRTAERWRELVAHLLATAQFRDAKAELLALWLDDPDFRALTRSNYHPAGAPLRSPLPGDCDAEIARLGEPWMRVEPRIDVLMQRHRQFLIATGDPQYFVRAVHALGTALIRSTVDQPQARARKAQALARDGLDWEPYDRHLWSLWRDALAAEGVLEAAELVGWEFVRRDPDDVDAHTQLATLIAEALHRPEEAVTLLRDTIAAFPQEPVARNQLATLLAEALHRPEEAVTLLSNTIAAVPQSTFARNQFAELLIATGRLAEAEAAVNTAFAARVVDEATYALRARLQSHRGLMQEAAATVSDGLARFASNPVLRDYQRILAIGRPLRLRRSAAQRDIRLAPLRLEGAPSSGSAGHSPSGDNMAVGDGTLEGNVTGTDRSGFDDACRYGRLRRLRFRAGSADPAARQAALEEVQTILHDDPAFAYAGVLAARYGLTTSVDALPSFAVAFEQALAQEDRQRLETLAKEQPRLQALILVARAILGDETAAWQVDALLKAPADRYEPRSVTMLRANLQSILAEANDVSLPQAIALHRDMVRRCLYDANEAALGDRIAA